MYLAEEVNALRLLVAEGPPAGGDFFGQPMFLMVAMFAVFYFIVFRPERKKEAQRGERVSKLQRGDEVVLKAGFFGKIDAVNDDGTFNVEIADRVRVKVTKAGIDDKYDPNAGKKADPQSKTTTPTSSAGAAKS
jgi:preprotein translocase subunit YajC